MLDVDIKYLRFLSGQLKGFKNKSSNLWNFRCPFCGDSQKKVSKTRGYVFKNPKRTDELAFKCHNCSKWCTFNELLKTQNSELHREYLREKFYPTAVETVVPAPALTSTKSVEDHFHRLLKKREALNTKSLRELEPEHWVRSWVEARQIPVEHYDLLFFAPDFKAFITSQFGQEKAQTLISNEPRLVIPFFNKSGEITTLQGRSLLNNKLKYITIKFNDEPSIFGLDRVNENETVYIVEGPLDSLFLRNAVAVAGLDLVKTLKMFRDPVFLFDNEKYNDTVISNMQRVIEAGKKVVLWPRTVHEKDVNDYVKAGKDIKKLIAENTFSGLEAKVKFQFWRM